MASGPPQPSIRVAGPHLRVAALATCLPNCHKFFSFLHSACPASGPQQINVCRYLVALLVGPIVSLATPHLVIFSVYHSASHLVTCCARLPRVGCALGQCCARHGRLWQRKRKHHCGCGNSRRGRRDATRGQARVQAKVTECQWQQRRVCRDCANAWV